MDNLKNQEDEYLEQQKKREELEKRLKEIEANQQTNTLDMGGQVQGISEEAKKELDSMEKENKKFALEQKQTMANQKKRQSKKYSHLNTK